MVLKGWEDLGKFDFGDGEVAESGSTDPALANTNVRGFATSPKAERSLLHPLFGEEKKGDEGQKHSQNDTVRWTVLERVCMRSLMDNWNDRSLSSLRRRVAEGGAFVTSAPACPTRGRPATSVGASGAAQEAAAGVTSIPHR